MSYVLPQVQVFQEFQVIPTAVVANLNAFVFGPNYQLFRYAEADEKADIGIGSYDPDSDTAYDYPNQPAGSSVDLSYTKLIMENVWAEYISIAASETTPLVAVSTVERNKLRAAPRIYIADDTTYRGTNSGSIMLEDDEIGGFYTGGVSLPEDYYFYPVNTNNLDTADNQAGDVTLAHVTNEGYTGSTVIEATDNPLAAGNYSPIGDGIVAKLSSDGTNSRCINRLECAGAEVTSADNLNDCVVITPQSGAAGATTITLTGGDIGVSTDTGAALANNIKAAAEAALVGTDETNAYFEVVGTQLWVLIDEAATVGTAVVDVSGWTTSAPTASTPPDGGAVAGGTETFTGFVRVQSFKFTADSGTELVFTLNATGLKAMLDADIDSAEPFVVTITDGSTVSAPVLSAGDLPIEYDNGTDTLGEIRAAILASGTVGDWFDATVLTTDESAEVATGTADSTGTMGDAYPLRVARDSFRINIEANPYVFATGNGVDNSDHFKTRGVKVGDRLRYSVVGTDSLVHEGTTYVTALEADDTGSLVDPATASDANAAGQTGTDLTAPGSGIIQAGSTNQRDFDGTSTALRSLNGGDISDKYPGQYSEGILEDTYTVEITTSGAKGTAYATVSSVGGYYREGVPVEDAGSHDGVLFIGNNMVIEFDQGSSDTDANFKAGDTYTFSEAVTAPFNAQAAQDITVSGEYRGPEDTTYVIEVTRGGVFNRDVSATSGEVNAGTAPTIEAAITSWAAGDVDDEYILRCTTAGDFTAARFSISSLRGIIASGLAFEDGIAQTVTSDNISVTLTAGSTDFVVGDYYVINAYGTRPQVRISDTAGVDSAVYEVVNAGTSIDLGVYGVSIEFDTNTNYHGGLTPNSSGGLNKGDVFYVAATAAGSGAIKTLVLADDLPEEIVTGRNVGNVSDSDTSNDWIPNFDPTEFSVWLYLVQGSSEIESKRTQTPPEYNWEGTASSITVNSDIAVQDAGWVNTDGSQDYLPVYKGDMYVEYRALLSGYADGIYSISDIGDVVTTLGTVHPDNPLAQGVFNALSNSGDQPVYFMGVPTDDLAGYSEVFDRASLVDVVYGFVPLTTDTQVLTALEGHIDDLSGYENKRWRIGFVATDLPDSTAVYTAATSTDGVTDYLATVTDNPAVSGDQYTLVTVTNNDPTMLDDVAAGDKVRIRFASDAWGDADYEEYTVASVETNSTLLLESGPAVAVSVAAKIEIHHPNSANEIATAVKARSEGFANRRIYHIFPDTLFLNGVAQGGEFAAASVAGLVSSSAPQRPLTSVSINGFDDVPSVYRTYNREQLNTMASGGTLILMQDQAGGQIYIRHQVSTATVEGNLLTQELSITKNFDAISYYFASVLEPFYGKYNITPELLDVLATQVQNGLNFLGSDRVGAGLLGPMIILENGNTEIRSIEQHPTLRDHIVIIVDLELPLPANVIQLRLVVGDTATSATING